VNGGGEGERKANFAVTGYNHVGINPRMSNRWDYADDRGSIGEVGWQVAAHNQSRGGREKDGDGIRKENVRWKRSKKAGWQSEKGKEADIEIVRELLGTGTSYKTSFWISFKVGTELRRESSCLFFL